MQQIKIGEQIIDVKACYGAQRNMLGAKRESLEIILYSDYETVVNTFVDGIVYSLLDTNESMDADGTVTTQTFEYDKTDYCLSGDIVDHRDGTISVFMGQMTAEEELLIALYGGQ